jgi:hypothetical protein
MTCRQRHHIRRAARDDMTDGDVVLMAFAAVLLFLIVVSVGSRLVGVGV